MTKRQKAIVAVTNDLITDQRAHKICSTLMALNYEVLLVGRIISSSQQLHQQSYAAKRFQLWFNKGVLFYANYNLRLFFLLLFKKCDLIWSNDLDTLPACFFVSKIKNNLLIFDSHEYFTQVPELVSRPIVQAFWKNLEKFILPKIKNVITVSDGIAALYNQEYKLKVKVVRNVPVLKAPFIAIEEKHNLLLYQGAINVNRGIETMVKAMQFIDNATLQIVGNGDIFDTIQLLIEELKLTSKVQLIGEIPYQELEKYTKKATIGLSLEEDIGLNYRLALPNKLFDYIHAGIPVLVADLPEMSALVKKHQIGDILKSNEPKVLALKINEMLANKKQLLVWKKNTIKAKQELNWEKEALIIKQLLADTI